MDKVDRATRSTIMRAIKGSDTEPELAVRRALRHAGYRYRLHATNLPGRPDIFFKSRRKAIFVHGCFWHRHAGCKLTQSPASNKQFWQAKFARNVTRDKRNVELLRASNWDVLIIWECQVSDPAWLDSTLRHFLGPV